MKKTPLYQWHVDNGANMAEFGTYLMPLWYPQGVKTEHFNVIERAGLFDTSHMATILVRGAAARLLLQQAFTKDLDRCIGRKADPLYPGRCVYGIFLSDNGHVIDDAIVYQVEETLYMVVVNAGMGGIISEHLTTMVDSTDVTVTSLADALGKIDIQGPLAARILAAHLQNPDDVLSRLPYFSFKGWFESAGSSTVLLKDDTPILLSRTGYTGEFGFEIFVAVDHLERIWRKILEIGGDSIAPCGLAARDSLRAGAVLPLSHQDIGEWPFADNPWQFALPLDANGQFTKSFMGSLALQENETKYYTYPFAGFDPRKISVSETSGVLDGDDARIGDILTCTTDMAIGRVNGTIVSSALTHEQGKPENFRPKGLSCGFIRVNTPLSPADIVVLTDGKRKIKVEIREDIRPGRTARYPLHKMLADDQ